VDIGAEGVIRIDGDGRVRGVLVLDGCAGFPGLLGIVAVHTAKVGAHRRAQEVVASGDRGAYCMQAYKVRLFYDRPEYTVSLLGARVLTESGETV